MNHSTLRLLTVLFLVLSLFFACMPEVMNVTNSAVSFVIQQPFPPENTQKSPLTNGVTRDFSTLRKSLFAETINPLSRTLFIGVHLSLLIFGTLFVTLLYRKRRSLQK